MKYTEALKIAENLIAVLSPHCDRISIAGSIRRQQTDVNDIEIVAIPKPYEIGLFQSGIATVINQWPKVRGELPCKYTRRKLPEGIEVDIFFAVPENWGYILAIRTGSDRYSKFLAAQWVKHGYKGVGGYLTHGNEQIAIYEEQDLFRRLGLKYLPACERQNFVR